MDIQAGIVPAPWYRGRCIFLAQHNSVLLPKSLGQSWHLQTLSVILKKNKEVVYRAKFLQTGNSLDALIIFLV